MIRIISRLIGFFIQTLFQWQSKESSIDLDDIVQLNSSVGTFDDDLKMALNISKSSPQKIKNNTLHKHKKNLLKKQSSIGKFSSEVQKDSPKKQKNNTNASRNATVTKQQRKTQQKLEDTPQKSTNKQQQNQQTPMKQDTKQIFTKTIQQSKTKQPISQKNITVSVEEIKDEDKSDFYTNIIK